MWLLKTTIASVVLFASVYAQYGSSSGSAIRGGPISSYGIGYGGSDALLYGYGMGMPYPYGTGYGYGGYPGIGGGMGSMIGYPGYGMGPGMGYPGFGMPGYPGLGGAVSPYGPMTDSSGVYSGSNLGSPYWNPYGSSLGGFGTDTSFASLSRPFTTRQKEASKPIAKQ